MKIYKYNDFIEIQESGKPGPFQTKINKGKTYGRAGEVGSEVVKSLTKNSTSWWGKALGKVAGFAGKWFGNLYNISAVIGDVFNLFAGVNKKEEVDGVVKTAKEKLSDLIDKIKGKKEEELNAEAKAAGEQSKANNESIEMDVINEKLIIEAYEDIYTGINEIYSLCEDEEIVEQLNFIEKYLENSKYEYCSI